MYLRTQLENQMRVICTKWDDVEDEELLAELYDWVAKKYPLLTWNKNELSICTGMDANTLDDVYECRVSKIIIAQCNKNYPEILI